MSGSAGPPAPDAVHLALARDLLARGLCWRYREASASMVPAIRPYDVVEVQAVRPDELRPGDVVAVLRPEGLLVHRLVGQTIDPAGERWLTLRGDARAHCDPPQPAARLLGRVTRIERKGRTMAIDRGWPRSLLPLRRLWHRLAARLGRR